MFMPDEQATSGAVVVTAQQMWEKLNSIDKNVHSMNTKIESIADHEQRIRALERRMWIAMGMAIVIGGVVSAAVTFMTRAIAGV